MKVKQFFEYVDKCTYKECDTKGNCKGCYEEYLKEKEVFDLSTYNMVVNSLKKQFNIE